MAGKNLNKKIKDFFSKPKCESCGETMEDHGYHNGGASNEPSYVCTNETCDKSDWYRTGAKSESKGEEEDVVLLQDEEQANQRVTKYDMDSSSDREKFNDEKSKLQNPDQISTDDDGNVITRENVSRPRLKRNNIDTGEDKKPIRLQRKDIPTGEDKKPVRLQRKDIPTGEDKKPIRLQRKDIPTGEDKKPVRLQRKTIDRGEGREINNGRMKLQRKGSDGKVISNEDFNRMVTNYGKIDLSESEIISILEETQNPVMSKSELMESITNNLLNEAGMDDSVRRSFESGNNDYSEHLDRDTINNVANQAFDEIKAKINEKTGSDDVSMDDIQHLLGQSLMSAAREEFRYGTENLEQKAVQMIRDQFNIPEDAVEFDAEITGLPPMMLVGRPDVSDEEAEQLSQQIGAKVSKIDKGNLQYEKGNDRPPEGQTEESLKPKVTRRRFTNAMMHGAARKSQNLHHLDDELRQNNPQLGGHYANIMSANDASYWMMSDESIKEQGRQGVHAGNVRVELSREEGGRPKIIAQGIVFPILLHELAKGVVELMSLWSLPQDADERKYVLSQTDHLGAETNDIRLGPTLWTKFVNEIPVDNQDVISLTWHMMQELPDEEFNGIVEGLLSDQEQARNAVKSIAEEAIEEIRQEGYDDAISTDDDGDYQENPDEDSEEDQSDTVLDNLMNSGSDEPENDETPGYEDWDTSDLRREFDDALDDGDMELVKIIGDILSSR